MKKVFIMSFDNYIYKQIYFSLYEKKFDRENIYPRYQSNEMDSCSIEGVNSSTFDTEHAFIYNLYRLFYNSSQKRTRVLQEILEKYSQVEYFCIFFNPDSYIESDNKIYVPYQEMLEVEFYKILLKNNFDLNKVIFFSKLSLDVNDFNKKFLLDIQPEHYRFFSREEIAKMV